MKTDRDGDYWVLEAGDYLLEVMPFVQEQSKTVSLGIECSIVHRVLSEIANRIIGTKSNCLQPFKWEERRIESIRSSEIISAFQRLLDEELSSLRGLDANRVIQEFALQSPGSTTMPQLMHLAALAATGDVSKLLLYKDVSNTSQVSSFVPFITQQMIDRAVELASERYSTS